MMGQAKKQQKLTDNLEDEFAKVYFLLLVFLGMLTTYWYYILIKGTQGLNARTCISRHHLDRNVQSGHDIFVATSRVR